MQNFTQRPLWVCVTYHLISILCIGIEAEADVLLHVPVVSAIQGIDVILTAESPGQNVVQGRVFFRQIGQNEYVAQPMLRSGDAFEGKIPGKYVDGIGIEYYIVLYMAGGERITSPEQEPASLPHVIVVLPEEQKWLEVLYPEANSVIEDARPQISAAFDPDAGIDGNNVRIELDGIDITGECEITQDFLLYMPSRELNSGNHLVEVTALDRLDMFSFWHFSIAGAWTFWKNVSGLASVEWQWCDTDSESPFLIYNPGSGYGLTGQVAGHFSAGSFDTWVNSSTLYSSRATDFGFGFYGEEITCTLGDIFPSISKLTLDGMPVRGAELDIKPFDWLAINVLGGEIRLFDDADDEFTAGLLNSRFGGIQITAKPFFRRWGKSPIISTLYIHARNFAQLDPDAAFSIEKRNDIFSLRTRFDMPASFAVNGEWVRSDHVERYDEGFVSESHEDEGIYLGLSREAMPLKLEMFYMDVGSGFLSEVNPFIESDREGFGLLGTYYHRSGLSVRGEYGRYRRDSGIDTEFSANINLSLSRFPSAFFSFYQQRVPYAEYDIGGISMGASYRFWRLDLSVSGSWSEANLWTDDTERTSISAAANASYRITDNSDFKIAYSRSETYSSESRSQTQRQVSGEIQRRIGRHHRLGLGLKSSNFTNKENIENDYYASVLSIRYGYSF